MWYTAGWNVWGEWFLAGTQGNHQNFDPSLLTNKLWLVFMGLSKKFFFWKKKPKMADSKKKKLRFSKQSILNIFSPNWSLYTAGWNVWGEWFLAGTQGDHQNFDPSLLTNKLWLFFMGMKQTKIIFFWKKKIPNGRLKKRSFFKIANS